LKKVFFFAFILLSLFVWSACSRNEQGTTTEHRPEVGSAAPDFTLKDLRGREVRLSSYRGHVVLVDFWATWCPPCKATIPELISVEERYGDKGVIVLGVSIDEGRDVSAKLSAFSREHNMNYPVLIGTDAVEDSYDITSIPTMLLVDKEGKIRDLYRGYRENFQKVVSAEIEKLL
jgi:cytochrome c biogenesis protein CcmG/thiol:disulfide interchange protein DsbE